MPDDYTQMRIRLPVALHEAAQNAAKRNEHSLNSEIVDRLASTFFRHESFDINKIFAMLAGAENAKLMQMIASALYLVVRNSQSKDPAGPENMEAFCYAVSAITRAHSGKPDRPIHHDDLESAGLQNPIYQTGIIAADTVLRGHELPGVVEWPKPDNDALRRLMNMDNPPVS